MSEKLRPLDDRIIVRLKEAEKVSRGGILLPDSVKEKPSVGEVIAVGPGKFYPELVDSVVRDPLLSRGGQEDGRAPLPVKVGDKVLFSRYSGYPVPDDDMTMILRVDDILAVVEKE